MVRNTSIALALVSSLALATPAAACIVNPDEVTISMLAKRARSIALAEVTRVDGRLVIKPTVVLDGERIVVTELVPGPLHAEITLGQTGLVFITRDAQGDPVLLGQEFGWLPGDDAAVAFVRKLIPALGQGPNASFGQLAAGLDSRSDRVRQDAIRDLARDRLTGAANPDQVSRFVDAASAALGEAASSEPAARLLARLPGDAGLPSLLLGARRGNGLAAIAAALESRPTAFSPLISDLQDLRGKLAARETLNIIEVLGLAQVRAAAPAINELASETGLGFSAVRALARIADPRSLATLKDAALKGDGDSAAWAAIGLAFIGGDEAVGALEFAGNNHKNTRLRALITAMLKDPAAARDRFEARGLTAFNPTDDNARPKPKITIGGPSVDGVTKLDGPKQAERPEGGLRKLGDTPGRRSGD